MAGSLERVERMLSNKALQSDHHLGRFAPSVGRR
jgi:hypothetical protein